MEIRKNFNCFQVINTGEDIFQIRLRKMDHQKKKKNYNNNNNNKSSLVPLGFCGVQITLNEVYSAQNLFPYNNNNHQQLDTD